MKFREGNLWLFYKKLEIFPKYCRLDVFYSKMLINGYFYLLKC
ncbi:hypothetical protein HMPREF6123_1338 [Oribacterium sinus F0268]|uniref:Uncharacterized protein n=1 Tax=Oribacterium sinus F0268 TaxID=585501 RepID=C2KXW9_9FIRM|nr:hypothetical protein HMPREF6123_1338 [Oribacterium sinus F0268]